MRKIGGRAWKDVHGAHRSVAGLPFAAALGRTITLFFYDGPISQAVAFEGLLSNGEQFAQRLLSGFSDARTWPQLMHIATDGETYGHHHQLRRHGAGLRARPHRTNQNLAKITNYGEFLEKHPPTHEAEIVDNSSWSCVHGVERWRADCGCSTGGRPGWNQEWRAPVRQSLDWLRDELRPHFEQKAATLLKDPWAARNDYIDVVLDRSLENLERFFAKHARPASALGANAAAMDLHHRACPMRPRSRS